ncbi:hypothetical protein BH09MYX1_BH09MYX1_06620 [soil metagenome]
MTAPGPEKLPRTVDRYELLAVLGSGAFATVYRARHVHTEQPVAVKVLQRGEGSTEGVERWLAEARAMASVIHPNVVRVLDCGRAATGEAFLVMELDEGTTLETLVDRGPLTLAHAVRLACQILDGLAAAHAKGIVHRDVKPANVLVTHDAAGEMVAKLIDFGVSKNVAPAFAVAATLPGTAIGTPGYMAPELFGDARNADARVDVYAVAATLFEMLASRLPFSATTYEDLVVQVRTERPPPLATVAPQVPSELAELVDRGLARNRDARWPSAKAFADALRGAISVRSVRPELDATMDGRVGTAAPTPIVSEPPPAPSTLRSTAPPARGRKIGMATLAVVLAGALVFVVTLPSAPNPAVASEKKERTMPTHEATRFSGAASAPTTATATADTTAPATTRATADHSATASAAVPNGDTKIYGGESAFVANTAFTDCPGCDGSAFAAAMRTERPAISLCFKASVHEPPLHEFVDYHVHVDGSGHVTAIDVGGDKTPNLDRCLGAIVRRQVVAKTTSAPGEFGVGFQGECAKPNCQ